MVKIIRIFFCLPIFIHALSHGAAILDGKLPSDNKRYPTFLLALQLIEERKLHTIVETGTSRCGSANFAGDGGSTLIFGQWVLEHGGEFYSVDIDPNAIRTATKALNTKAPSIHFVTSDSIAFLARFRRPIDFLYLDSFDFDPNDPLPSQYHHLQEIQAAYFLLSQDSVILIDDCAISGGGKGKLVIEYLLSQGWEIAAAEYQVLLIRKTSASH